MHLPIDLERTKSSQKARATGIGGMGGDRSEFSEKLSAESYLSITQLGKFNSKKVSLKLVSGRAGRKWGQNLLLALDDIAAESLTIIEAPLKGNYLFAT